ncbi:1,2-phenylacetyl-CoA epoxidase subunit PaaD [Fluviicola taffensis]|uniref:Phenylacetate-CoA oxygenase, PaaJ subunit n=1 Tax=Fluviicola taffensis (strain DSM 16823 / NCIMB 13979 / RW262) TaxID=755732 RepID=F2ICZ3_FLUTR|nr:1,2-phenylacetyl-CoA epoxidase subunit PaaD [Fluviicola taffensis]AEA44387.1 phenylacetate-CoA oxygenase, PaaJ subunit [Fluviicola taffensis DSM 16823]
MVTESTIWSYLEEVPDPEVPVLSIIDLGIVRGVKVISDSEVHITITPTYSGCPAMNYIEKSIQEILTEKGFKTIHIDTILAPAWTTDWMSENGKKKLLEYGIAPPVNEVDKLVLFGTAPTVKCPQCGSKDTKMLSQFGSTACKALYQCTSCLEPFDYFKCLK